MRKNVSVFKYISLVCFVLALLTLSAGVVRAAVPPGAPTDGGGAAAIFTMRLLFKLFFSSWFPKAVQYAKYMCYFCALIGLTLNMKDVALQGNLGMESVVSLMVRYVLLWGIIRFLLENNGANVLQISDSLAQLGKVMTKGSIISGLPLDKVGIAPFLDLEATLIHPLYDVVKNADGSEVGKVIVLPLLATALNIFLFLIPATVLIYEIEVMMILVCGIFTASFVFIPFFKDMFLGYLKGLAIASLKLSVASILLGVAQVAVAGWGFAMFALVSAGAEGLVGFTSSSLAGLLVIYMMMNSVPGIAAAILTGSPTGSGPGMVMMGRNMLDGMMMGRMGGGMFSRGGGVDTSTTDASRIPQHQMGAQTGAMGTTTEAGRVGAQEALMVMSGINGGGSAGVTGVSPSASAAGGNSSRQAARAAASQNTAMRTSQAAGGKSAPARDAVGVKDTGNEKAGVMASGSLTARGETGANG